MSATKSYAFALCAMGLLGAGCEEAQYANTPPQEQEIKRTRPTTEVPLASPQEREAASRKIAEALCARAERCGKIGDGERYASRGACEKEATQTYRDELDMYGCPGSIVEGAVQNCAEKIRDEGCIRPVATLARMVDCDANHLCQKPYPSRELSR